MQKPLLLLLLLLGLGVPAWASHIRAGEITARRKPNSSNTFDFTLTIYRDKLSGITDPTTTLFFGDGTSQTSPSDVIVDIPLTNTEKWTYQFSHTYGAAGVYVVFHHNQFRNANVVNIPQSGAVEFYVETRITISPSIDQNGPNNSPVLLAAAVDLAGLGQKYLHNPAAYDPDGDSLSYELTPSRSYIESVGRVDIPGFQYPNEFGNSATGLNLDSAGTGPATLTINPRTGLITWDVANRVGQYNFAFYIYEWRYGRRIGYVIRDMQVIVKDLANKRPIIFIPNDTCIIAGSPALQKTIIGVDRDTTDKLAITAAGGMFTLNPLSVRATINPASADIQGFPIFQDNPALTRFRWQPGCEQVRQQPYEAVFKVQDKPLTIDFAENSLVDIKSWAIWVIGAPPDTPTATPGLAQIRLDWSRYYCSNIQYFNIYRRIDSSTFRPDTCVTGVPAEEGYTLIGFTDGVQYSFLDDNNGLGLKRTARYCYRITAVFSGPNGGESKESAQVCAQLRLDVPLITHVSVRETDKQTGKIFVDWARPRQVDTARFPGPYRYVLKRSAQGSGVFATLKSTTDLNDTTYLDENLDTDSKQYTYRVVFFFTDPLGGIFRDSADDAANIRLTGTPASRTITLNWSADVPWDNRVYTHYVFKEIDGTFSPIDTVPGSSPSSVDAGTPANPLVAGQSYRYYVVTRGRYSILGLPDTLVNYSYIISVKLKDTVPPCPPDSVVLSNPNNTCPTCEEIAANPNRANILTWIAPRRDSCALDLSGYNIYFKPTRRSAYRFIAFTTDTFFVHSDNGSLAGCYKVVAVDSSGNQSDTLVQESCNDNCVSATLPNVITPNSDGKNDYWRPICITKAFVASSDLKVYNRWGGLVYSSTDADIRWPGPTEGTKNLEPGTYYYLLKLKVKRLDDDNGEQTYRGWIEVVQKK